MSGILIGGHRGLGTTDSAFASSLRDSRRIVPENTIEAFQGSFAAGADFIEFDVVPAKDGLVVSHSARLSDHIFGGTDAKHTTELTITEISQLKTGHRGAETDRISTLDDMLAAIAPIVKAIPNRFINLELKEVQESGLLWSLDDALKYADGVHRIVAKHGMMDRTLFSSFNSANLQAMLHHAPEAHIAQLFDIPDEEGNPMYGDPRLARYMSFTPAHVEWTLANMPSIRGLNPPLQAFMPGGQGESAFKAAIDFTARSGQPMPGIYIWAMKEHPVAEWKNDWKRALDICAAAPRRAVITDYPADMRAALG